MRNPLQRIAQYDADNLAVARDIAAHPESHIPALQDWARRVLARLGDHDDARSPRLPLFDSPEFQTGLSDSEVSQ